MILSKINRVLARIQTVIAVVCLMVFFCGVTWQVASRILGIRANFTEELSNYAFIWVTFMGTSLMFRENRHFRFTAFAAKMKGRLFFANTLVCQLILLGISLMIFVHGIRLTRQFWTWHFTSMSRVSLGYAWLCLPISGLTAALYELESILKFIRDPSTQAIVNESQQAILDAEEADRRAQQIEERRARAAGQASDRKGGSGK